MHDPFGRSQLPADFSRTDRVRLLEEVRSALLDDRSPSRCAAMFVGGALQAWLSEGGDLERDYLRVRSARGSHATASSLWRALRDEDASDAHRDERQPESVSVASQSSESERTS